MSQFINEHPWLTFFMFLCLCEGLAQCGGKRGDK